MIHDPLCPNAKGCTHDCGDCLCLNDAFCQCDFIAKVRDDERKYILEAAADEVSNHHTVKDGQCVCLAYVESKSKHIDDIIRYYVASALPIRATIATDIEK